MFSMQTMWITWNHNMRSWVFNHKQHGVKDEPFILGFSNCLTEILKSISDTAHHTAVNNGFRLTFSEKPIPSAFKATLIKHEDDGAWYQFHNGKKGWVGPIVERILKSFPLVLYLKVSLE